MIFEPEKYTSPRLDADDIVVEALTNFGAGFLTRSVPKTLDLFIFERQIFYQNLVMCSSSCSSTADEKTPM